jgi:hypothetical protein
MATARFRRYVESGEIDDIAGLLAEDVVFRSPTMDVPLVGRSAVIDVLHAVHEIFRDFRYTDALQSDDSGALFFSTRIGREEARGLDYLRLREDGLISQFHVYIAPLPAVATLSQAMFPRLLRRGILPIPSA